MSIAPQPAPENPLREELQSLRQHWLLLLILGISLTVLGTVAIVFSAITALATAAFLGMLLFIGAIIEMVEAVTCRCWRGFLVSLLTGILFAVAGLIMMNHPVGTVLVLTLMLAAAFMAGGVIRIVGAAVDRFHGWGWVMLSGFISLFLGIYIWKHLPESAFWVIGVFIGVEFIFAGWSWIFLALGIRSAFKKA
jgi:uncharacterized membrane protein HdeD (DUF308 family)